MKDLASHIMDIVQNSIRACAGEIDITLMESQIQNTLTITIHDNGCGMTPETLAKVRDPFFTSRTVRKVGLGIPLLQQNAERTGGKLDITSTPGKGTTVTATFGYDHLDRPPLGNMAETLCLLIGASFTGTPPTRHPTPSTRQKSRKYWARSPSTIPKSSTASGK